jgi:hypothetical protein|tara:strand:- start:4518 stop:4940 length:423 start_codon:yes stop_codon:yes gene_type:complete
MKQISADLLCPACNGALYPRVLECRECGIKIEAQFEGSEFNNLSPDEFHFLRIFISCEGRIRDMESALGVSYPTVKARLASLKQRLGLSGDSLNGATEPSADADGISQEDNGVNVSKLLEDMEKGVVGFDDAMKKLKDED